MKKIGLICHDDIKIAGHSLFSNYKKSLMNYFNKCSFIDVSSVHDLNDSLDCIIIADDHFAPHVQIWKNDMFIEKINNLNLRVCVLNNEKVYSSQFPWNIDHQNKLETIKKLTQLFSDVEDFKIKGGTLNKHGLLSRDQKFSIDKYEKKDRILFLGQAEGGQYHRRQVLLNQITQKASKIPIDIKVTNRKLTYNEFIETMAQYKYILNPLGTADFINLRFYEALELGCIPIQQFTDEMIPHYSKELEYCIPFVGLNDINLNKEFKKMDYYMEDFFEEINLANLL